MTPAQWIVAGPVVKTWVANLGFDSMKQSRLYLSAATSYTAWALTQGLTLDDEVLLTDQAINMFCAKQGRRAKTLRSSLRRIARGQRRNPAQHRSEVLPPPVQGPVLA